MPDHRHQSEKIKVFLSGKMQLDKKAHFKIKGEKVLSSIVVYLSVVY